MNNPYRKYFLVSLSKFIVCVIVMIISLHYASQLLYITGGFFAFINLSNTCLWHKDYSDYIGEQNEGT
jgi:hypothetical protein